MFLSYSSLNTEVVSSEVFADIYVNNISDPSFKGTVLTCDIEHEMNIFYQQSPIPKRFVSTPISKSF